MLVGVKVLSVLRVASSGIFCMSLLPGFSGLNVYTCTGFWSDLGFKFREFGVLGLVCLESRIAAQASS